MDNYRTYGHCLRFSDTRESDSTGGSSDSTRGAQKNGHLEYALVVLSPFPFFDSIRAWLVPVVKDMLSSVPERRMSIEPRISSLVYDALAIRSNHISTKFNLLQPPGAKTGAAPTCLFSVPGDSSVIPPQNFSMHTFFAAVNPSILVSIFEMLLHTGQVLFVSRHVSLLTVAAQSCISLMWPLSWDFAIYIPVLPNQIGLDAMNFPNAAITGMLRSHPEMPDRLEDILYYNDSLMIVDLDESRIVKGVNCLPPLMPAHLRNKLMDRLRLIFAPSVVFCDEIDLDMGGNSSGSKVSQLTTFGSKSIKATPEDQVKAAFMMLLRDICDNTSSEIDEFKAAFLSSPIYSLYQRNAGENSILRQLIRMTEENAEAFLLGTLGQANVIRLTSSVPPAPCPPTPLAGAFHSPKYSWTVTEAPLVTNVGALPTTGLNLFKLAFPSPMQRAAELFQQAESAYLQAVKDQAPATVLSDWILLQVTYLLRLKRHHDCLRLLSKLESEHPIFLCVDLMTLLMESLTMPELEQMSMRQTEDRLGDAARAFRETKSRQNSTTLSPESKELFNFIVLQDDNRLTEPGSKFLELLTGRNVNVNATPKGLSLLSTAVSMGKLRMAAHLLRFGAAPDSDNAKNSIAHCLCSTKPRDEVSYLLGIRTLCLALATGYNINRVDTYQATPLSVLLMRAVPCIPLLKFLLLNGSDVNSLNVDACPPVHFLVKSRIQQLTELYPLTLLLDFGANPLLSEPSANSFRALIGAASDAITANLQPFAAYMDANKYLSAKYAMLRALKSSHPSQKDKDAAAAAPVSSIASQNASVNVVGTGGTAIAPSPGSAGRMPVGVSTAPSTVSTTLPPLPTVGTNAEFSKATPPSPRSAAPTSPSSGPTASTAAPSSGAMSTAASSSSSATPASAQASSSAKTPASVPSAVTPSSVPSNTPAMALGAALQKPAPANISPEASEATALANYAIVDAQYRQLVIITALVHSYLSDIAKRKRKGATFGFSARKKSTPHDAALALTGPLSTLLSHHTTLSVDIRHHTTMNGSKPSVAACFASKMTWLAEVHLEFVSAFYQHDGRIHLDAMNADDMVPSILQQQLASFNSLCGPWSMNDTLLGNLITEVLDFPSRLSVLFEEMSKKSALSGASDYGKIQVLLTQLAHLRNRQDAIRHESVMSQVFEEIGSKVSGVAQFSFMMKIGTTLLHSGSLKIVRNFGESPAASRVQASDLQTCRAYLFATSDDTDNKGYLVLASDGGVNERRRIPLKKTVIFDIPAFAESPTSPSTTSATAAPVPASNSSSPEPTLSHSIGLVTLHPSSTPHEYYMLECNSAESKSKWLSYLWRICFEGRNYTHKKHLYEFNDRSSATPDYEGWLDYSIDSDPISPIVTHYFSLRGNRLVATLSPNDTIPISIIYLDEYTLLTNDEPSLTHSVSLQPTKHLAPRYLLYFGTHPKVLSKYPLNNPSITDWRSLLRMVIQHASAPSKM